MRSKLVLAGLVAGAVTAVAPLSPASAVCGWDLEGMQNCSCLESEVAQQVDTLTADAREEHGVGNLNDHIVCAH